MMSNVITTSNFLLGLNFCFSGTIVNYEYVSILTHLMRSTIPDIFSKYVLIRTSHIYTYTNININ